MDPRRTYQRPLEPLIDRIVYNLNPWFRDTPPSYSCKCIAVIDYHQLALSCLLKCSFRYILIVYIEVELEATHSKNTTTTNPQQVLACSQILERSLLRVLISHWLSEM